MPQILLVRPKQRFRCFIPSATGSFPRIRNLGSRRLYVITPSEEYRHLDALIAGKARLDVIEQHWDEVLRLKASIGAGLVPPSVILKKLAALLIFICRHAVIVKPHTVLWENF